MNAETTGSLQDGAPTGTPAGAATTWRRVRAILATSLPRGALVLSILTFAGYVMGLVRDRAFARTFGASGQLDAYNAAFILPELLLDVLVAGGLVAPFVPIFTGLRAERADEAREFGRTILTWAVLVMAAVAALLFVFAPETIAIIAPGFVGEQRQLYVDLFRVMCVTPVIFAASMVLGEVLVAERHFFTFGLAPLMYNGGIVAGTLLLADRYGIYAAAIGAVAGALGHLAIRIVGISRTQFRPWPRLSLRASGLGEFVRLMIPRMVSHPIEPLTFLYFTAVASTLDPGSVSSVSFARNFESVPVSLVGASFAIAAFPTLSAAFSKGDRRTFSRTFGTNLATITVLTVAAGIGLFVVGGMAIRILLGGGAFDEEDIARTSSILAVFAIAIPLESLTHLLTRALYATHNTLLPSIASVAGFVTIVIAAEALAPSVGVTAIPAAFGAGMAVKVALLAVALAPRMARIGGVVGRPPVPLAQAHRARLAARRRSPVRARLGTAALIVGLLTLTVGGVYALNRAMAGATLSVAPEVTPWVRVAAPAISPTPAVAAVTPPATSPSPSASHPAGRTPAPSATPAPTPVPSPTPKPGPFSMDLYQKGDFVGEYEDTWCVPAAMQTSMNIMDAGADTSRSTQQRLLRLARKLDPATEGTAEPEGWAAGLQELGYGNYEVAVRGSIGAAVHVAAKQIRLTNRPAGLLVWRGVHSWVMSGFTATADPALTDKFDVTEVRIEDVWYNRLSSIWGWSRPPDAHVAVADLPEDFLPWNLRHVYPDKDGKYVIVVPVE